MILIGLGANLVHPDYGSPRSTLEAALKSVAGAGVAVRRRSRWYRSAPVPPSDQPWFVNGVAELAPGKTPAELLQLLHGIEAAFGRVRRHQNEARVVDLDILAYNDRVSESEEVPILPHPRLGERAFVVLPLAELAADWRHPVSGLSALELSRRLDPGHGVEPIE